MKTDTSSLEINATAAAGADVVVSLAERFDILASQRFDAIDCAPQEAYRARRHGQGASDLMAIVTGIAPLARTGELPRVKAVEKPGLLKLMDWGVVEWPGGDRRLALIFERPLAPPIMRKLDEVRPPMGEEELVRALLAPAASILHEFHTRGIYHGAIRPTNVFFNPASAGSGMLGECVSSLAGFTQPAIFETIERGLAEPSGRGPGASADDLYALGVTAAILAMGRNPICTLPDAAQIELKIERGTYAAVIGNARIPTPLHEPLRGLLSDDPVQRWRVEDLVAWVGGRRQNPRQPNIARRTQRPVVIGGAEVWTMRSLSIAMGRNVLEAAKLIESGEIDRWLRRSLADPNSASRLAESVANLSSQGKGGASLEERVVSRACMALDPTMPIRFRGRSVMPQGVAGALSMTLAKGEAIQPLAELISAQLPQFWYSLRLTPLSEQPAMLKIFDHAKSTIDRNALGQGPERCLYDMIPTAPCLSDMVVRRYVNTPSALLQALETLAGNPSRRPATPIDRHVAAFLASRDRNLSESLFSVLTNSPRDADRQLAMLNILGAVQGRFGPPQLPKLAAWFLGLMSPVIERFHSRKTRRQIQKEAGAAAERGDLSLLQGLIDNPDIISRDQSGFEQIRVTHAALSAEIARLSKLASNKAALEQTVGREAAAVVSSAVALLLVGVIVLVEIGL